MRLPTLAAVSLLGLSLAHPGWTEAVSEEIKIKDERYSPYLGRDFPQRVWWGDTHVHTSYSTDAGMVGNFLGPDKAYEFALGREVVSSTGVKTRLQRPLDFLVVADHAENLGLAPMIAERNAELLATPFGNKIANLVYDGDYGAAYALWGEGMSTRKDPLAGNTDLTRTMWQRITEYAEQYNDPGRFTALIGFEWTSSPDGNNLHRNIIFRDGKARADQVIPLSNYDTSDPEELWAWMAAYERKTGGKMLAIPHNGNLSNGLMFDEVTFTGRPLTRDYAERRMRWEPLYEVTQMKGDGETHPALSPTDEFADYGTWDKGSFGPQPKTPDMLPREYARSALERGLAFERSLGANPFKFGMIGSTDTHTSLATTEENNFFGKAPPGEPGTPGRLSETITGYLQEPGGPDVTIRANATLSSGLAGVWARENTRASLWDALQRREVFGSTGTRLQVRVFAGWELEQEEVVSPDFAAIGYRKGVPMGGDLTGSGKAARIMVQAMRDPDGANLDRIQVVKGWLDAAGKTQERVIDVACSDGRPIKQGRCDGAVGNTVDIRTASYTNSIGEPMLSAWWEDPAFDPGQPAFYYVRVLEIPTPTWTTYDAAVYGTDLPDDMPATHQERAYTSPIWYSPGKASSD